MPLHELGDAGECIFGQEQKENHLSSTLRNNLVQCGPSLLYAYLQEEIGGQALFFTWTAIVTSSISYLHCNSKKEDNNSSLIMFLNDFFMGLRTCYCIVSPMIRVNNFSAQPNTTPISVEGNFFSFYGVVLQCG